MSVSSLYSKGYNMFRIINMKNGCEKYKEIYFLEILQKVFREIPKVNASEFAEKLYRLLYAS